MPESKPPVNQNFTKPVVYQLPYAGEVRTDITLGADPITMDIYYPEDRSGPVPVVVMVFGFRDPGFQAMTGMKLKQIRQNVCWAELLAASGMAAVLYSPVDPVEDVLTVIDALKFNAAGLNIDAERIGIWSVSGNVPNALHVLDSRNDIACAALCYGFMLDLNGATAVADASAQFKFANPNAGESRLPETTPMLIVRAGKDEFAGLNQTIDEFVTLAQSKQLDLELLSYEAGVHAFDVDDDSEESIAAIKKILSYLQERLGIE